MQIIVCSQIVNVNETPSDVITQRHARISRGNPPVPLKLKTLLQAYRFESSYGKQIKHLLVMYFLKYVFWKNI